jgi:NADPH-dependent 2,4-dienoyl-CoA reductase/sulfur reductase-like enzyme
MTAASRARRLDPDLDITVYERTGFCAYSACGLPYHVAGVIPDHEALVVRTPEEFAAEGVTVLVGHDVSAIDVAARTVRVRNVAGGRAWKEPWDALVLAAGARPEASGIPGASLPGVFTVRTIEDARAIRRWIADHDCREAAVIGAGYIGLEMAEAFRARDLATTVIEPAHQVLPLVDADVAEDIAAELAAHAVDVVCGVTVDAIAGPNRVRRVIAGGASIAADIVVIAVGVRPDTRLAAAARLPLGPDDGIVVDEGMRTGVDGVWAAGDCCQTRHLLHDGPSYVPLGTTANKQGRVAGANVAGGDERFAGVLGTAVVKIFDLEVGRTGLGELEAANAGFDVVSASVTHLSRAGYYPGRERLRVKLVAERGSGRLLGGQIVGREGVAKRIDVVAAALHARATAAQLEGYDLSYAPPFAPVWDPVLIAARKTAAAAVSRRALREAV